MKWGPLPQKVGPHFISQIPLISFQGLHHQQKHTYRQRALPLRLEIPDEQATIGTTGFAECCAHFFPFKSLADIGLR